MADEAESLEIPLLWVGVDDVPIIAANQFALQADGDEITLIVGQASPPMILGTTEEEKLEALKNIPYAPVKPLARLALSPRRFEELLQLLQRHADYRKERAE